MLVNTALVRGEVAVHSEGHAEGSVGHELRLDLLHAADVVGLGALLLVAGVRVGAVVRLGAALLLVEGKQREGEIMVLTLAQLFWHFGVGYL